MEFLEYIDDFIRLRINELKDLYKDNDELMEEIEDCQIYYLEKADFNLRDEGYCFIMLDEAIKDAIKRAMDLAVIESFEFGLEYGAGLALLTSDSEVKIDELGLNDLINASLNE